MSDSSINSVYTTNKPSNGTQVIGSVIKKDRLQLLDKETAYELNTYRNWGQTLLEIEPIITGKDSKGEVLAKPMSVPVTKSIFNNINATPLMDKIRVANNIPMLDTPETRKQIRDKSVCTVKELVRASAAGEMGRAIYNYSDFMYCKHLGKIPNNYLITLRRFPFPCDDHINYIEYGQNKDENDILQHSHDIGRMVTWLGTPGNEMSNILKYNYNMPWKSISANIQEQQNTGDGDGGLLNTLFNASSSQYQQQVADGVAGSNGLILMQNLMGGQDSRLGSRIGAGAPYASAEWLKMHDQNKIYGPLDVIADSYIREDTKGGNGGLKFSQEISLVFDYELRSYDGINGKAAFLDLLGNILTVTYTTGTFWGGSIRMYGAHQSNVFANLPIYKSGTNVDNFVDRLSASFETVWGQFKNVDFMSVIKGFGNMLIGGILNKLGRPHKIAFQSMLSPMPTGPWHVTIGNPKNPIMMMGNMILDSAEIEHYGPLGLDDFPTGIKITVKLKHGKPRDQIGIEKMYLMGDNRIYLPAGKDIIKLYSECKDYKNNGEEMNYKFKESENETKLTAQEKANIETLKENAKLETLEKNKDIFIKFFGTNDSILIEKGSEEGSYGSEMKKKVKKGS